MGKVISSKSAKPDDPMFTRGFSITSLRQLEIKDKKKKEKQNNNKENKNAET